MKINAERMIRWFISSFIIIVASVFEWEFFSQFISLLDMIVKSTENQFIVAIILVYLILIIVFSVLCSKYLSRSCKYGFLSKMTVLKWLFLYFLKVF